MTETPPPRPAGKPKRPAGKRRFWLKFGAIALAVLLAAGLGAAAWTWNYLYKGTPELPTQAEMWTLRRDPATEFRAMDGSVIAIRGPRYGQMVEIETLPPHVPQAFIAAEDKRFYEHDGADTWAIIRAAWSNWRSGRTVSGASTITQQLVKNLVLSPDQTLRRKAQEVRLARQLEERYTKDEILGLYLNRVYFGAGFYGLDAASQHYFGKEPSELTIGEAALLAALPQAPSRLALTQNMEEARRRQAYVLGEMVSAGFLTTDEAELAARQPIELVERPTENPQFGYILDAAAAEIPSLLETAPPDLVVTLTIEPDLQTRAQALVASTIVERGPDLKASQAAAIIIRNDGRIAAMVGGTDYATSEFNRATQARRQPGSAFKAVVYTTALMNGTAPYDVRQDAPLQIGTWRPQNYTGQYLGPVTISEAYAESLNTVAAQLTQEVGEEAVIGTARRLGIIQPMQPLPSIALGSQEISLHDLTRAYGAFMNDGMRLEPYLVARISDTRGNVLYEYEPTEAVRAIPSGVARDMNAMMVRVVEDGTGRGARVENWSIAGKTGTSQDWRDAWFVGYARPAVVGVWVGNDDDSAMARVTGGGLPAELFAGLMGAALEGESPAPLPGAERFIALSDAAEQRVAFYRNLAGAFSSVSQRDTATLAGAARVE